MMRCKPWTWYQLFSCVMWSGLFVYFSHCLSIFMLLLHVFGETKTHFHTQYRCILFHSLHLTNKYEKCMIHSSADLVSVEHTHPTLNSPVWLVRPTLFTLLFIICDVKLSDFQSEKSPLSTSTTVKFSSASFCVQQGIYQKEELWWKWLNASWLAAFSTVDTFSTTTL